MSRIAKSVISLVVAGLVFGVLFGGAASLDISGAQKLGSGSVEVESPAPVTSFSLVMDRPGDTQVVGVKLKFGRPGISNANIDVQVSDGTTILAQGSVTNTSAQANQPVRVDLDKSVPVALISKVAITVTEP